MALLRQQIQEWTGCRNESFPLGGTNIIPYSWCLLLLLCNLLLLYKYTRSMNLYRKATGSGTLWDDIKKKCQKFMGVPTDVSALLVFEECQFASHAHH